MQKMMKKDDTMMDKEGSMDKEGMMKDDSMMDEKQKMKEEQKINIRAKIENSISHLSDEKKAAILERISVLRITLESQAMSETKRATYYELLDLIEEVLTSETMQK